MDIMRDPRILEIKRKNKKFKNAQGQNGSENQHLLAFIHSLKGVNRRGFISTTLSPTAAESISGNRKCLAWISRRMSTSTVLTHPRSFLRPPPPLPNSSANLRPYAYLNPWILKHFSNFIAYSGVLLSCISDFQLRLLHCFNIRIFFFWRTNTIC